MKILIFMADNRAITPDFHSAQYNSLATVINYEYAKKFGYDFVYYRTYYIDEKSYNLYNCVDKNNNSFRHASWSKILCALNAAKQKYDYIVYIDSDCIFRNLSISIEEFINTNTAKDIIFFNNKPWGDEIPCAGFFICKVNEYTIKFLESWYNVNIPEKNKEHPWEQDALHKIYKDFDIQTIDAWTFKEDPNQFIRHICHVDCHDRIPYFTNLINTLKINYSEYISKIDVNNFNTNIHNY
jgi:hypothetical protein